MRKTHYVIVALTMLAILIPQVSAETKGLTWGVTQGDRFDFTMHMSLTMAPYDEEIHEDFYVTLGSLPDLDVPGGVTYIPTVTAQFFWANGTEMFTYYGFESYFYVMPVGNWTHWNELIAPSIGLYEGELIDNFAVWGFDLSLTSISTDIRLEVSKTDGVPNLLRLEMTDGSTTVLSIEIARKGLPSLLLIGIGGAAVIVIVAVVFLKKR